MLYVLGEVLQAEVAQHKNSHVRDWDEVVLSRSCWSSSKTTNQLVFEHHKLFTSHMLLVKQELCWHFRLFGHHRVGYTGRVSRHAYTTDKFKSTSNANGSTNSACKYHCLLSILGSTWASAVLERKIWALTQHSGPSLFYGESERERCTNW